MVLETVSDDDYSNPPDKDGSWHLATRLFTSATPFFRCRPANMRFPSLTGCAKRGIVPAGLLKTQVAIRSTANVGGVVIILPIVLPKAHRTDFKATAFIESETVAARTSETPAGLRLSPHRTLVELLAVLFEPAPPRFNYLG
jgi:hypothetical protein